MDIETIERKTAILETDKLWLEQLNERLEKMVVKQDTQIVKLNGEIETLNHTVGKLTETVDKKDDLIQFFQTQFEERSGEYYKRLQVKEQEIMQLNVALRMEREKWTENE